MGDFKQPNLLAWALLVVAAFAATLLGARWWHMRQQAERRTATRQLSEEQLPSAYAHFDARMRLKTRGHEVYLTGRIANDGTRDVAGATFEVRCRIDGTYQVELGAWEAGASGPFEELLFEDEDGLLDCELGLVALDMGD